MITVAGKVRDVMGTDQEIAIDDEQLITIIGLAEKRIRAELFTHRDNVTPDNDPATGNGWNGSNTSFTVDEPIADKDFDESTADDVICYWWNSNDTPVLGKAVVTDAKYGRVTVSQADDSAIPATATQVYLEYYTSDKIIPFGVLEELGTLLTAHFIILRLTEPRKISLADLESNKRILEIRNNQFINEYLRLSRLYEEPMLRAT